MNKHGTQRGDALYGVVNTATGTLRWVDVSYTPPGEDPWLVGGGGTVSAKTQRMGVVATTDATSFMPTGASLASATTLAAQSGKTAFSAPATANETAKVQAWVRITKDQVLLTAPADGYFGSFTEAVHFNNAVLDRVIRSHLEMNNPALAYTEIGGSFLTALASALETHFGRGPSGCVVFNNGESGCFQVNILWPGAARFITGTRQDANGNVVPETGGIPNTGNRGIVVKPSINGGPIGFTPVGTGRSTSIVCGYVGGLLHSCYIQVL